MINPFKSKEVNEKTAILNKTKIEDTKITSRYRKMPNGC